MKIAMIGPTSYLTSSSQITESVAKSGFTVTVAISPRLSNVDDCWERWAGDHQIPVTLFPSIWRSTKHFSRNIEIAEYADGLITFGNGTNVSNMIANMKRLKKPIYIVEI